LCRVLRLLGLLLLWAPVYELVSAHPLICSEIYRTSKVSGTNSCYQVPSMKHLVSISDIRFMSKYDVPDNFEKFNGTVLFISMTQFKESEDLQLVLWRNLLILATSLRRGAIMACWSSSMIPLAFEGMCFPHVLVILQRVG
jgi:hypothetical protein